MIGSCLDFFRLIGRKATIAFLSTVVAGIALALTEAIFATAFVVVLKLLSFTDAPTPVDSYLTALGDSKGFIVAFIPCLALFRAAMFWVLDSQTLKVEEYFRGRMRQISFYRILHSEDDRYIPVSDFHRLNSTVFNGAVMYMACLGSFVPNALTALCVLSWMLWLKPLQSLFSVAVIIFIGVVFKVISKRVNALVSEQIDLSSALFANTNRIAQNWLLIRSSNLQKKELTTVSRINSLAVKKILTAKTTFAIINLLPNFIGICLISTLLFLQQRKGPTGDNMNFISMVYLILRFVEAASRTARALSGMGPVHGYYKRTVEFFKSCSPEERSSALAPFNFAMDQTSHVVHGQTEPSAKFEALPMSIEVKDLSYSFSSSSKELYRGLSFVLPAGQQMGLIGPSGSGKSTLLSLILGVIRPVKGKVLVSGKDVDKLLKHPDLRLGFVAAEPFLFGGSIKENLDYGQQFELSMEDYRKALMAVMLLKPTESVEAFLAKSLREDMSGLSMGEKQRICLARALLRRPNFLILDEMTANLDARTEAEVVDVLHGLKGKVTIIFVSHRVNALAKADMILDLETGTFVTYSELKARSAA